MRKLNSIGSVYHSDVIGDGLVINYVNEENETFINLENAFRHYSDRQKSTSERTLIFAEWVESFARPPQSTMITKAGLFPLIRHIGYLAEYPETAVKAFEEAKDLPDSYDGPLVRSFVGDLVLLIGHESFHDVAFVTQIALDEVGIMAEIAWETAFSNIDSDRFTIGFDQLTDEGLAAAFFVDEPWLTPTLLANTELFQELMESNDINSLLIAVPARSEIIFIDESLPGAMSHIMKMASQLLTKDHPQSEFIYCLSRGGSELTLAERVLVLPS